jgi:hypothetical protein
LEHGAPDDLNVGWNRRALAPWKSDLWNDTGRFRHASP